MWHEVLSHPVIGVVEKDIHLLCDLAGNEVALRIRLRLCPWVVVVMLKLLKELLEERMGVRKWEHTRFRSGEYL